MKFAVTGGAGFVGNNIVKLLVSEGHNVKVIDNLHTGKKENLEEVLEKIEFYNEDIRNISKLESILKDVDGIFHEAALTIVQESFKKEKEYFDVNVKGTKNIFEIAKENKIKVVFASSSSVYGEVKIMPITENIDRNPIHPYGQTKLECEFLAKKLSKEGLKVIGLRYFNVYGLGQNDAYAGVITKFLNKIKENKSPEIFGDGSQTRDFIFVKDVANANLSAMESKINFEFFNIGSQKSISILELAQIIIKKSGLNLKPEFKEPLQGDAKSSLSDITLAIKKLQWNPTYKLDKWFEEEVFNE